MVEYDAGVDIVPRRPKMGVIGFSPYGQRAPQAIRVMYLIIPPRAEGGRGGAMAKVAQVWLQLSNALLTNRKRLSPSMGNLMSIESASLPMCSPSVASDIRPTP